MFLFTDTLNGAKRNALSFLFALFVFSMLVGCASDNIHMPDPEDDVIESYNGSLTTSIPTMSIFEAVTSEDYIKISWNDKFHKSANLEIGAFRIDVELMNTSFLIGTMHIDNVVCTPNEEGTYTLSKEHFECQAGDYLTKGSLTGKYVKGKMEITIHYKPGSMPFECKSVFEGTSED